ncbi:hypothetical protein BBP40_003318 [Aspergillus hancockii]|nr:hypothetical protein BBP40_003318 [Aspergillus hancockii]
MDNVDMKQDTLGNTNISAANVQDLRVLGYLSDDLHGLSESNGTDNSCAVTKGIQGATSLEMENVLRLIPPKLYTDLLVQQFLTETNYQYYCIYPATFSRDYQTWWVRKADGQPLSPGFTCLLIRICAYSALFLDPVARQKLESELGENVQRLSERYHHAARQLSSTMSPGKSGLTQVQQLFLTACWFKTEALFTESWHALSSAIHEAQELGMHRDSSKVLISEFEREMRRRIWCILYSWDWQMSLLLSRPFIINSTYCSFELPNLRLECPDSQEELPSPITHMALQCQMGQVISKIPGVMSGTLSPIQAPSIREETEKWFASFPSAFRLRDTDTRWDNTHKYVIMQRHQLHVIGYMVMMMPLKQCLVRTLGEDTPSTEKSLQSSAIDCALKLIEASRPLLSWALPMNAKFYFAPFLIFDTAAFLCSAIIHDHSRRLPRRDTVIRTIGMAVSLLEEIRNTKTGAICYLILSKLVSGLSLCPKEKISMEPVSAEGSTGGPCTPLESQHVSSVSHSDGLIIADTASLPSVGTGFDVYTPLEFPPSETTASRTVESFDIPSIDLGNFSQIWDWGDLDLEFLCPPPA